MDSDLFKTKSIEQLITDVERGERALRRSLSAWDLTLLGIGGIIGTGIFVLTGTAAANQAGPAITMLYLAAGLACAFDALCYAEFASMIPIAGSAYTYAYATLGELVAWMIGWDLILEYAVGAMTVAIGWSGYMQQLLAGLGVTLPTALSAAPPVGVSNILAVLIVLVIMSLLVVGIRESARANAVMVSVKLAAVLFFLAAGAAYVKPENWSPFAPFGWSGIMSAAAVVFFAYLGFDAVSTTAEEATNPKRDLPIGIIMSLLVCTALYLAVAAVLSGIVPVIQYRSTPDALAGVPLVSPEESVRFLNAPVAYALAVIGQDRASYLVSAGAVAGITSVLLVLLMSQPRIFFAMSRDGLLPTGVSKVHPRFGTPYLTTIITCVIVALVAGVTEIQVVGEMTSIGTLFRPVARGCRACCQSRHVFGPQAARTETSVRLRLAHDGSFHTAHRRKRRSYASSFRRRAFSTALAESVALPSSQRMTSGAPRVNALSKTQLRELVSQAVHTVGRQAQRGRDFDDPISTGRHVHPEDGGPANLRPCGNGARTSA